MAHEVYAPVGYAYQADQYCLDCIAGMFSQSSLGEAGCNCAECVLDLSSTKPPAMSSGMAKASHGASHEAHDG